MTLNIFLLFSLFTPKAVYANFRDCSFFAEEIEVELATSFGKIEYDNSKDNRYISEKSKLTKEKSNGFTQIEHVFGNDLEFKIVDSLGLKCLIPTKISLKVGYENPKIYISKKFEKNSCEYGLIKRNQQLYLQMYKATLEAYLPAIYAYLNDYSKGLNPIKVKTYVEAQTKIKLMRTKFTTNAKKIETELNLTKTKAINLIKFVDSKKYEKEICE